MRCENNELTSLDIKNGNNSNMVRMWAHGNPNLFCINVDDETATYPICDEDNYSGWCKDDWASYSDDCSLGSNDITINSTFIYPNPVADFININSEYTVESIQLYNVNGSLLQEFNNKSAYVGNLSKGIYFVKISIDNKKTTKKFVKL